MTLLLLVEIVVVGLVSYRLWRLLAVDSITERVRDRLPAGVVGFVECPWCFGMWVGLFVTVGLSSVAGWWLVVVWLASSVVVGVIGERV